MDASGQTESKWDKTFQEQNKIVTVLSSCWNKIVVKCNQTITKKQNIFM